MLHFANLSCTHHLSTFSFLDPYPLPIYFTQSSLLIWSTLPLLFTPSTVLNILLYLFLIYTFLLSCPSCFHSWLNLLTCIHSPYSVSNFLHFLLSSYISVHLCVSGKFICLVVLHFSIANLDTVVWLKIVTSYWGKNLGDPE